MNNTHRQKFLSTLFLSLIVIIVALLSAFIIFSGTNYIAFADSSKSININEYVDSDSFVNDKSQTI